MDYLDGCAGPTLAAWSALSSTDYLACCARQARATWLALSNTDYLGCVAGPALVARTACLCMMHLRRYMCVGVGVCVGMGVDVGSGWR